MDEKYVQNDTWGKINKTELSNALKASGKGKRIKFCVRRGENCTECKLYEIPGYLLVGVFDGINSDEEKQEVIDKLKSYRCNSGGIEDKDTLFATEGKEIDYETNFLCSPEFYEKNKETYEKKAHEGKKGAIQICDKLYYINSDKDKNSAKNPGTPQAEKVATRICHIVKAIGEEYFKEIEIWKKIEI
ncbi:MAG: hypothetical protein IJF03_00865 [Lachnospiraceae bacterium]|nr:hypothetical protein [Lachnospiraceae bacterium]